MNLKKLGRYLQVNLLGPGPRLIKENLLGRGRKKLRNAVIQHFLNTRYCTSQVSMYVYDSGS
jgi:hypothetical protein